MKKQKTIKALDDISMSYIHGEIEPAVIWSLSPVDQITVLSFINIYSSCLQGFMSRESCKAAKLRIMSRHELLSSRISWSETIYLKFIRIVKEAGTKTCDMVKAIKANEPLKALQYAVEALDIYQGGNIYLQMFFAACNDSEFKSKVLNEGKEYVEKLGERYDSEIPYAKMIERFYSAADEDGMSEVFKFLDSDKYVPLADDIQYIEKIDDEKVRNKMLKRICELYGVKAA
ncbi:MAG: hypothetical protein ACI4XI_06000 [Ruminococcus sp.]